MTDNVEAFSDGQGLIARLLSSGESVEIPDHWLSYYQSRAQRNRGGRKHRKPVIPYQVRKLPSLVVC